MKALKSPLFIVSCVLFLVHQLLQHSFKVPVPFADAYLDNILAMPIILTLLVAERRCLFNRGVAYNLSLQEVLLTTADISLVSEYLFPFLSTRFVTDPMDFVFFFAGTGLYLLNEKLIVIDAKG